MSRDMLFDRLTLPLKNLYPTFCKDVTNLFACYKINVCIELSLSIKWNFDNITLQGGGRDGRGLKSNRVDEVGDVVSP